MKSRRATRAVPTALAAILTFALGLGTPPAFAQDAADNDTADGQLAGEESLSDEPGISYGVTVAALSLAIFVALLFVTTKYWRKRGNRPPP